MTVVVAFPDDIEIAEGLLVCAVRHTPVNEALWGLPADAAAVLTLLLASDAVSIRADRSGLERLYLTDTL